MREEKAQKFVEKFKAIHHKWLIEVGASEEQRLNRDGLTMPQFFTLCVIGESELMMKEVAARMCLSMAAASGVIDRLVKHGLVEREHDSEDRRKVMIRLSKGGRALLKKVETKRDRRMIGFFSKISETEAGEFLSHFEGLLENFKE